MGHFDHIDPESSQDDIFKALSDANGLLECLACDGDVDGLRNLQEETSQLSAQFDNAGQYAAGDVWNNIELACISYRKAIENRLAGTVAEALRCEHRAGQFDAMTREGLMCWPEERPNMRVDS
jgi:hypothetical protein